jgi:hypothetical protein
VFSKVFARLDSAKEPRSATLLYFARSHFVKIVCGKALTRLLVLGFSGTIGTLQAQTEAPTVVNVVIDAQNPGARIPDDFSGLSFETETLLPDKTGFHYFSATNTALVDTVRNLGVKSLRIGGNTADRPTLQFPDTKDVDSFFAFAQATSSHVLFTLRLRQGGPEGAEQIAKHLIQHYGSQITCFAIGNEPNVYLKSFPEYEAELKRYMRAFDKFSSGSAVRFCGPGTTPSKTEWARDFADAFPRSDHIRYVTQHAYPGNSGRKVSDPAAGISAMLSRAWVESYERFYESFALAAQADHLPFRIEETNSYFNGGAKDVSNTFASALWGLDYMYWWATHGAAGINFHTGEHVAAGDENTQCFYAVFLQSGNGYAIQPLGYAIKAFDIGGHGRVVPLHLQSGAAPINLTAYAVINDANDLYVTLINKEEGTNAKDDTVSIEVPAGYQQLSLIRMEDRNGGVTAKSGVTLGGVAIQENGMWNSGWQAEDMAKNGAPRIVIPSGTAAILRLSRGTSAPKARD